MGQGYPPGPGPMPGGGVGGGAGVTSFNGRTGAVTLTAQDITDAEAGALLSTPWIPGYVSIVFPAVDFSQYNDITIPLPPGVNAFMCGQIYQYSGSVAASNTVSLILTCSDQGRPGGGSTTLLVQDMTTWGAGNTVATLVGGATSRLFRTPANFRLQNSSVDAVIASISILLRVFE